MLGFFLQDQPQILAFGSISKQTAFKNVPLQDQVFFFAWIPGVNVASVTVVSTGTLDLFSPLHIVQT